MNAEQQTVLEAINHNLISLGNILIDTLYPKRKNMNVAPKTKRKQTLAETAIIVLSNASHPIHYMELRQRVRGFPYPHADKNLGPTLKRLLKTGVIKMRKSSNKHLYSIAQKPKKRAA